MPERLLQLIAARVLRELVGVGRVGLGPGLPEMLAPFLPAGTSVRKLAARDETGEVEVAVVDALQVSERGDLVLTGFDLPSDLGSPRWIMAGPMIRDDGTCVLVKQCRLPVTLAGAVDLVINDFGVVQVGKVGFELTELAPGRSSDDIRLRAKVSMHVADGLTTFRA